ncbi:MAG TPA: glycosyltransferase [Thermoanaerobaculia bacterium]|jgi:glycosyltransferase involved in cell wall biosynthesis|nr:glycosyltransferase [Thermoanaerobaculia bacterium]
MRNRNGRVGTKPHLLHAFSNFVPNGAELRTVALIGAFGGELRHSILSMDGRTSAAERLPAGVEVRLLPSPPRAGSLATVRRLRRLLAEEKPDLVLTYNWGAFDMLLAARSAGFRRLVHHEEGFNEDEAESFKLRRVLARRLALPGAHRLVVPSQRLQGIATTLWKLPADKIRLIPNGIPLDRFIPGSDTGLRTRLGIPAGAMVAGAVGSLRAVKNFARLLEACAAAPDIHVLVVGDGEDRPALERRAAAPDLAGRVHFAGYQADPAPFYRAMDLFALSSDSEQMPLCLVEAMASGLPVAATDVGDVRAMLPGEQAPFLVALDGASTAGALGGRIAALARDPAARRDLGRLNRHRAEGSFAFEAMRAAYREVYASALQV